MATSSYSNDIKTVLITDDVNEKCVEILANNDLTVVKNTKLSVEQLKTEIKVREISFKYIFIASCCYSF